MNTTVPEFPRNVSELTDEWFARLLFKNISEEDIPLIQVSIESGSKQGATSQVFDIHITYPRKKYDRVPDRFIVKFSSAEDPIKKSMWRSYKREVEFYNNFKGDIGIPKPICRFAQYDPETYDSIIVLDYIPNASSLAAKDFSMTQAKRVVTYLSGFHAHWWGNESELIAKNIADEQNDESYLVDFLGHGRSGLEAMQGQFSERDGAKEIAQVMSIWLNNSNKIRSFITQRVRTLCHNDFHPRQFSPPNDFGSGFFLFDWQEPTVGRGPDDLACLLFNFISANPPDQSQSIQSELLSHYYLGLLDSGVKDYVEKDFILDYKISLAQLTMRHVGFFGKVGIQVVDDYWKSLNSDLDMWSGIYKYLGILLEFNHVPGLFTELFESSS